MGPQRKAASSASREDVFNSYARLSRANNETQLNSSQRKPPEPRLIHCTQQEWDAKIAAYTVKIADQASSIEKLKDELQKAAASQQAMQNELQRRQTNYETDLNRRKTLHQDRVERAERFEREALQRIKRAEDEADRLRKDIDTTRRNHDDRLQRWKEKHQGRIKRVERRAKQAELEATRFREQMNVVWDKYNQVKEQFRFYKDEVSRKTCRECRRRLRPIRGRRYYEDFDTSTSPGNDSFD